MTASQDLILRMLEQFPPLRPLLDAHLEDMDGELLPYLLMADVARWAHKAAEVQPSTVSELTRWLEREFDVAASNEKDLIGLGFVETIPSAPEGEPLLQQLGPQMREIAHDLGLLPG